MSATTLLSAAEYLKRADVRTVAELLSDDDEPIATASVAAHANLTAALLGGSHDVEGRLVASGRYTAAGLAALTGTALGALYDLITPFVTARLYERRPDKKPQNFTSLMNKARWDLEAYGYGDKTLA